eukprot:TRINITY_DN31765_c0_g1_i1.p1 TRINITY_DN31765_c0_g1~~TRINITY_DN31765_c0_g1_i1.p1  ORF type:complete len:232 (-),score=37.06 TRINITY_DN31765_c0_g1_i1:280-933(-)
MASLPQLILLLLISSFTFLVLLIIAPWGSKPKQSGSQKIKAELQPSKAFNVASQRSKAANVVTDEVQSVQSHFRGGSEMTLNGHSKYWGSPRKCTVDVCNAVRECLEKSNGKDPKETKAESSMGRCKHLTHTHKACMWSWSLSVPFLQTRKCHCHHVDMYTAPSKGTKYAEGHYYTACPSTCDGMNMTTCGESFRREDGRWDANCIWTDANNRVACG